ncbi:MAG: LytTR family DNA-binding domain-containing protein [Bacteroidota bacterium]
MSKIKALIVEDEPAAVNRLQKELKKLADVEFEIIGILDSVSQTIEFLTNDHPCDLIFMDIHLTDGSSLEIFKKIEVNCPIIFTTAYDKYAIEAFKLNSIDYLLKPIDPVELSSAIDKFQERWNTKADDYLAQIASFARQYQSSNYRSSFLVSYREKMMMIDVNEVAYVYVKERGVFLRKKDEQVYAIDFFLDDLEKQLDPSKFYRANRQFLVSRSSILEIETYFNGRLILKVKPEPHSSVIISKEKATHFKRWADY